MVTTVPATVFVCGTKLLELQKSHFISAWDSFTSCDYTGHFLLSNQPTQKILMLRATAVCLACFGIQSDFGLNE